ncbi:hypothetical protein [Streptomyces sp. CBMA156]|uniref:hypothetical protein n=1 Tax=Streptomyces sp. CBMA156 TaxID=1930280 RepID=UPI001661979B|nr:hypothetical protein [Streptomyces sp. CBMA156]MBD0674251.1 hypothetical protein [Streptomyces sp. CBMA156]
MAEFGCAKCYGEDEQAVWRRQQVGFEHETAVVDGSRFAVNLRRCRDCSQRFVWIFTEVVDWMGGDDAQYVTIMPVTADEATGLTVGTLRPRGLGALGRDRRRLNHDWPTGGPARLHWNSGRFLVADGR